MSIQIRLLKPTELDRLPIPINPEVSICVIAEDNESKELKGYWVAPLVVHTEPVWLDPALQGGVVGLKMFAALLATLNQHGIQNFYAFAQDQTIAGYLDRLGLQLEPYVTFKGQVPKLPAAEVAPQESIECQP